jgi:hypothetical protein
MSPANKSNLAYPMAGYDQAIPRDVRRVSAERDFLH